MKPALALAVLSAALTVSGCTESKRAAQEAAFNDRPADITCWSYGTQTFIGQSTGKVENSRSGRTSFVDAANGRYTTIDGDCRVVYKPKAK